MAQTTWTPQERSEAALRLGRKPAPRTKFLVGGFIILAAIAYLIVSGLSQTAQFYLTIDELRAKGPAIAGRDVRVSGAVIGDSIAYDAKTLKLRFTVANVTNSTQEMERQGGLAAVLEKAVKDPNASRMEVEYTGPKPDLLKDQAQAIMTGQLGEDGVFRANELLLKCPTRYEEASPAQGSSGN